MAYPGNDGAFPVTDWQRLEVLRQGADAQKLEVLGELYARYQAPVLAYLRGRGFPPSSADTLTQDFFTHSMESGLFEKADPKLGRFRNLMLTALKRYAAKCHRRDQAQVRRPTGGLVSGDALAAEGSVDQLGADEVTPELEFQRAWARELIAKVLGRMDSELGASGKAAHLEIFKRCVVAPALDGDKAPSHQELAAAFGLSEKEVGNRLVTAKRAYQRLLRAEIAAYTRTEKEIDEEIGELFQVLGAA